jgi:cytochrome P450
MSTETRHVAPSATDLPEASARCPIDHTAFAHQKTARVAEPEGVPIERDAAGVWHVRGYDEARAILRSADTKQAGFKADLIERIPGASNTPILYQEGKVHQAQRRQTARFFTPKTVSASYRSLMERLSGELVGKIERTGRADLSRISMTLAVRVAAEVVGLTNSRLPGMDRRLNAFFSDDAPARRWRPGAFVALLRNRLRMLAFFFLDVKPAIQARRRAPREDVISHLIAQGYNETEMLTECVTYGAAGMVTTREFICVAAWHLIEQPELRARYLASAEAERHALLEEILRLEPVVAHLQRRATADIPLETGGERITIPAGDLVDIHICAADADTRVVGDQPLALRAGRPLSAERASPAMLGFGDGHHRCPGSYIAIQEADIFLQRLLALGALRIVRAPLLSWNDLTTGYELRDFIVSLR